MIAFGLVLVFVTYKFAMPFLIGYGLLLTGVALLCFGVVEMLMVFYWINPDNLKKLKDYHKQRMKDANKGVVWIWAVALAGLCVYAIAFYAMVYPTLMLIGIVEGMTTWSADASFTLNLVKTVLNWHPILFIIGTLIWAFVNSQRREEVTYPVY